MFWSGCYTYIDRNYSSQPVSSFGLCGCFPYWFHACGTVDRRRPDTLSLTGFMTLFLYEHSSITKHGFIDKRAPKKGDFTHKTLI